MDNTNTKPLRILLLSNGAANGTSGRLFETLSLFLSQRHNCRWVINPSCHGNRFKKIINIIKTIFFRFKDVWWADVIVVHSYVFLSSDAIILGKLFGKRVIGFIWDIYPSSINGIAYDSSLSRRLINKVEHGVMGFVPEVIIPSSDFKDFVKGVKVYEIPIWPKDNIPVHYPNLVRERGPSVDICFTGQINLLRGLEHLVNHLSRSSETEITLHIFSNNALFNEKEVCKQGRVNIQHHGCVPPEALPEYIRSMDFGLVCLHPGMDQPGFPSKTFDYVASGLPVLYYGKDLPAYIELLEHSGVGKDISRIDKFNLLKLHAELNVGFEAARNKFLEMTQLNWDRFDKVL